MIAYNRAWLDALRNKEFASDWHEKGLISNESWSNIKEKLVSPFYSPNWFVRLGLAFFCLLLLAAGMGLTGVIVEPNSEEAFLIFCLVFGCIWIAMLEQWAIKKARHYGSGVDDMLLYAGLAAILTGLFSYMPYSTPDVVRYAIALPLFAFASIRYTDRLLALAAFVCGLQVVLLTVKDIPQVARYLLPLSGMGYSALVYFWAKRGQTRYDWRFWHDSFDVLEMIALATFYASGNIFMVQEGLLTLLGVEQVPVAWLFWVFTIVTPVVYILEGLRRRDRLMLDIGLGCIAAAVGTIRYYYHVISLAWAAVIGGAVMFLGAYFAIQYLRRHKGAFTYEADGKSSILQEIQEQLIEQTIANQPSSAPVNKESMGGGAFGGGGASGEF